MRRSGPPALPATRSRRADDGMTLVELMVGMLVLGVFLIVLSAALISLNRLSRQHADLGNAQQSARQAFLVMDKQIRYADAVSTPAVIAGDQWIEWRVTDAGQSRCYQWRASGSTGLLQFRSWVVPASGGVSTPPWTPVASGLSIGSQPVFTTSASGLTAAPFSLPSANATYSLAYARVGVALTVSLGSPARTARATTIFAALNATGSTTSVCTEVPRS